MNRPPGAPLERKDLRLTTANVQARMACRIPGLGGYPLEAMALKSSHNYLELVLIVTKHAGRRLTRGGCPYH